LRNWHALLYTSHETKCIDVRIPNKQNVCVLSRIYGNFMFVINYYMRHDISVPKCKGCTCFELITEQAFKTHWLFANSWNYILEFSIIIHNNHHKDIWSSVWCNNLYIIFEDIKNICTNKHTCTQIHLYYYLCNH
jgi:hypothetical protein